MGSGSRDGDAGRRPPGPPRERRTAGSGGRPPAWGRVGRLALLGALLLAACDDGAGTNGAADAAPPAASDLAPVGGTLRPLVLGVRGTTPDEVWFVGGRLGPGVRERFVARFDGRAVAPVAVPPGPALWWVWAADDGRVWACGEEGRILRGGPDGWVEEPTGLGEKAVLWGLWGSGPDDLWAVGGSVRRGGPQGIVLRSAGDGWWRRITDPAFPTDRAFYKVWGSGPDDVLIVGDTGVAVHWDGAAFRRVDAPVPDLLFTVHGRPGGPVLAVGGLQEGRVVRWTGDGWVDERPPSVPALNAVFVFVDGSARVVGARGTVLVRDPAGAWRRMTPRREAAALARFTLHATWGAAPDAVWAVGGDLGAGEDGVIATSLRPLPGLASPDDDGIVSTPPDGGDPGRGSDGGGPAPPAADAGPAAGRDGG